MDDFPGFKPATMRFLARLGQNNNKAWFDANRDAYEAHYVEPAKAFVAAVADPLRKIAPAVCAEPRINGSIFRINRDIRFSADKTPYKDHIDLWFWEGERKSAVSGFFFRLTSKTLIVGAGAHHFDKDRLSAYRSAVAADRSGNRLKDVVQTLENKKVPVNGVHYSRLPRGFETDDPARQELLRHKALWVSSESAHPPQTGSAAIVDYCIGFWRIAAPLHRWLTDTLSEQRPRNP